MYIFYMKYKIRQSLLHILAIYVLELIRIKLCNLHVINSRNKKVHERGQQLLKTPS